MTPEQFTYWLQGYSEINGGAPTAEQWQVIQDHLATVFNEVAPPPSQIDYREWARQGPLGVPASNPPQAEVIC